MLPLKVWKSKIDWMGTLRCYHHLLLMTMMMMTAEEMMVGNLHRRPYLKSLKANVKLKDCWEDSIVQQGWDHQVLTSLRTLILIFLKEVLNTTPKGKPVMELSTWTMMVNGSNWMLVANPYRVDERGRRRISSTTRPSKYSPEEWRKISPDVRKSIAKAEEKKMEAEVEKKKSDALIKAREEKKKKKEDKKSSKSKPKDGGDDHITGVAKPQDHVRRGKCSSLVKRPQLPSGAGPTLVMKHFLHHPTLMSPLMTTSSSTGTNGLRSKVGVAQRLLGTTSTCMTLARGR